MSKSVPNKMIHFVVTEPVAAWLKKTAQRKEVDLSKLLREILQREMVTDDPEALKKAGLVVVSLLDFQELKNLRREHHRMLRLLKP